MNRARNAVLPALLCLAAVAAAAQEWRGPASLALEVKGKPKGSVEGALVILRFQQVEPPAGPRPVLTDSAGRAVLADLAPGVWEVEVSHQEYLSFVALVMLEPGRKPTVQASFLQASGSSLTPIRVKFMDGKGRAPSASVPMPPEAAARLAQRRPPPQPKPEPQPEPARAATPARAPEPVMPEPELRPLPEAARPVATPTPRPLDEPTAATPEPEPPAAAPPPRPEPAPVIEAPAIPPAPEPEPKPALPEPEPRPVTPAPAAPPESEPQPVMPETAAPEPQPATPAPAAPPEPEPQPVMPETAAPEPQPATPAPAAPPEPDPATPENAAPPEPQPQPVAPAPAAPEPQPQPPMPTPAAPPAPAAPPEPEPQPAMPEPAEAPGPESQTAMPEPAAPPEPEPTTAEPAPAAVLPAPGPLGPELRAYRDQTCIECRPGEWAISVEAVAGPAASPCADPLDANGRELAALLGRSVALELKEVAAAGPEAAALMGPAEPSARVLELLADDSRPCRVVVAVIPKAGRVRGMRMEAADASGVGDCQADRPCPVGRAKWLGQPRVYRESSANVVWGLFVNDAPDRARRARLTVYFAAPYRAWNPSR